MSWYAVAAATVSAFSLHDREQLQGERGESVLAFDEWMEEQLPEEGKGTKDDPKRYARPKAMKDLVTLHLLLMALRVCQWSVDLTALAKRLKLPIADLIPHCKELGCKIAKTTGKKSEGGGITKASLPLDGTKRLGDLLPEIKRRLQAKGRG